MPHLDMDWEQFPAAETPLSWRMSAEMFLEGPSGLSLAESLQWDLQLSTICSCFPSHDVQQLPSAQRRLQWSTWRPGTRWAHRPARLRCPRARQGPSWALQRRPWSHVSCMHLSGSNPVTVARCRQTVGAVFHRNGLPGKGPGGPGMEGRGPLPGRVRGPAGHCCCLPGGPEPGGLKPGKRKGSNFTRLPALQPSH